MTRGNEPLTVALIATVLNEGTGLDSWLAAMGAQTRRPDLIVIVDGGSSDDTFARLQEWAATRAGLAFVHQAPGTTIAAGRNVAISMLPEHIDVVAVTDAGTVAEPGWLAALTAPFADDDVDVVAGFWTVRRESVWERALAAATMPDAVEIRPNRFLPSSRSVAVRRGWLAAGLLYPEWLDYCEDLIFDLALLRAGARMQVALDARVEFRVRPSVRAFWLQYLRYACGDGKSGLFARRHAVRYLTYACLAFGLWRRKPVELALLATAGTAYVSRPLRRVWRHRTADESAVVTAGTSALTVALVMVGDVAKTCGYPQGLAWRKRVYGALGRRTTWHRINPAGRLLRPSTWSTADQATTSRHADALREQLP